MAIMPKLCVAAALCASAATAMPLAALLQGGAATGVRSVKDLAALAPRHAHLAALAPRHAQMAAAAGAAGSNNIHNGTVTVVETNTVECEGVKKKWSVPAEACLPNGQGGSGMYVCGAKAVVALGLTAYEAGSGCFGKILSESSAVCDVCQPMGGNSTTFAKIDCAQTSTEQGARVSVCGNNKCDKDCVVKAEGHSGHCIRSGDANGNMVRLHQLSAAGFVAWVEWPETTTCTGAHNVLFNVVNKRQSQYLMTCSNKLGH